MNRLIESSRRPRLVMPDEGEDLLPVRGWHVAAALALVAVVWPLAWAVTWISCELQLFFQP